FAVCTMLRSEPKKKRMSSLPPARGITAYHEGFDESHAQCFLPASSQSRLVTSPPPGITRYSCVSHMSCSMLVWGASKRHSRVMRPALSKHATKTSREQRPDAS